MLNTPFMNFAGVSGQCLPQLHSSWSAKKLYSLQFMYSYNAKKMHSLVSEMDFLFHLCPQTEQNQK